MKNNSEILRLTPENAVFGTKNGFPSLILRTADGEVLYPKVSLRRSFPFELAYQYISVLDSEESEIGLIYDINEFTDTLDILKTELSRRYYEPHIKTVSSLKERYGFSYWRVTLTDGRSVEFTMQDTFKNIIKVGEHKLIMLDVDGNRFLIDDTEALDKKSHKRLELYI